MRALDTLLTRALQMLESLTAGVEPLERWCIGGGTVLMRRHRHRLSRNVDVFVPAAQVMTQLSPRSNPAVRELTTDYVEQERLLKLYVPEGEIKIIASGSFTTQPTLRERILGHDVNVETSAEIIAKKFLFRGAEFGARDILDLALIAEREPQALSRIAHIMAGYRGVLLRRLAVHEEALREDFAALDLLEYRPSYEACLDTVLDVLAEAVAVASRRIEQPRAPYHAGQCFAPVPLAIL